MPSGGRAHTEIEITVNPSYSDELIRSLEQMEDVIGLSITREASIKPPVDVLTVHALNRGVDDTLRLADTGRGQG